MTIEAMIFDLDGTLVQTEKLKAISYAQAAIDLCPEPLERDQVVEAFKDVVGLSRREVAQALVERFDLEPKARPRMQEFGVTEPWQAYVQIRLEHYRRMIDDPSVVRRHRCVDNLKVLQLAGELGCRTGLATMSGRKQALRVLEILDLRDRFDFCASREDVEEAKPHPEIYRLVSYQLGVSPDRSLVLEDSASGVTAAVAAGAWCIAVTNEFTRGGVHALELLEPEWIVDEGEPVVPVVQRLLSQQEAE